MFSRDMLRMGLGLGAFLIAVAGMYLYFSMPFLAVAQVFVYVGGVLVLILFAIMLLHTRETGAADPRIQARHRLAVRRWRRVRAHRPGVLAERHLTCREP